MVHKVTLWCCLKALHPLIIHKVGLWSIKWFYDVVWRFYIHFMLHKVGLRGPSITLWTIKWLYEVVWRPHIHFMIHKVGLRRPNIHFSAWHSVSQRLRRWSVSSFLCWGTVIYDLAGAGPASPAQFHLRKLQMESCVLHHCPTPQVLFPTVDPKRRMTKIPRVPLPLYFS